ncbi:unnamed protein product [Lupinus luteus]|uniref:Pectinesterase inhibitor domain-containing protein n=1 Tax=Lupinus luteus TaxID=3873 RepID=A0AAV1XPW6_LUPLU
MNSSKVSYLFFTLSVILIFSHSLIPTSCKTLYESVCDDTRNRHKEDCLIFLEILTPSAQNYVDLANSVLDFAISHTTHGQEYISNFNKKNQSPAIQKCVTTFYPESVSSFKKAKAELVKDPVAASHDARLAGNGPSSCADAIKAAKIKDPLIDSYNEMALLNSDIVSVAARKIVKKL